MSGPCLSSRVAGRPLRPATRHSLGEPLPHQLADRPRAHREASGLAVPNFELAFTSGISSPFSKLFQTSRQITHVLHTLAPLQFANIATRKSAFDLHVLSTPPAFLLSQNQTLRKKRMESKFQSLRGRLLKSPLNLTVQYLLLTSTFRSSAFAGFVRSYKF